MKKRIALFASVLLVLALMLNCSAVAFASDSVIDYSKKGEIGINVKYGELPIKGAEFTIYRVAGFDKTKTEPTLVLTSQTKGYGVNPMSFGEDDAFELMNYVERKGIKGISKKSDKNGKIRFNSLELGVYLVEQTESVEGYGTCRPFLVTIPYASSGKWSYRLDATPKVDVEKIVDVTVTIIWPPDTPFPPEGIIIELYDGDELIDTIVLKDPEDLTYTWEDLPYSGYTIKVIGMPDDYKVIYDEETKSYIVMIEEEKEDELIKTGQNKLIVPALALSGIVCSAMGIALLRRGRKGCCD